MGILLHLPPANITAGSSPSRSLLHTLQRFSGVSTFWHHLRHCAGPPPPAAYSFCNLKVCTLCGLGIVNFRPNDVLPEPHWLPAYLTLTHASTPPPAPSITPIYFLFHSPQSLSRLASNPVAYATRIARSHHLELSRQQHTGHLASHALARGQSGSHCFLDIPPPFRTIPHGLFLAAFLPQTTAFPLSLPFFYLATGHLMIPLPLRPCARCPTLVTNLVHPLWKLNILTIVAALSVTGKTTFIRPSPFPFPSTHLTDSILVFNPSHLAEAKRGQWTPFYPIVPFVCCQASCYAPL